MTGAEQRRRVIWAMALIETVADMGLNGAPSGHCYMALNMAGCDIDTYQSIVGTLVGAKLLRLDNHVLYYIGPRRDGDA